MIKLLMQSLFFRKSHQKHFQILFLEYILHILEFAFLAHDSTRDQAQILFLNFIFYGLCILESIL